LANKDIRLERIAQVAGAGAKRQRRRYSFNPLHAGKRPNAVLVIENNALKKLHRQIERAPGIVWVE